MTSQDAATDSQLTWLILSYIFSIKFSVDPASLAEWEENSYRVSCPCLSLMVGSKVECVCVGVAKRLEWCNARSAIRTLKLKGASDAMLR